MTENELIKYYERAMEIQKEEFGEDSKATELYQTTIGLIKEIQQYRAIGTVEEIEGLNFSSNQLRLVNLVEEYKEKLKAYEAIGTVEECQENKKLLEFLYDTINPNDMESYMSIYNASDEKSE